MYIINYLKRKRSLLLVLIGFSLAGIISIIAHRAMSTSQEVSIPESSPSYIFIDQFGYYPKSKKTAVIAQPCFSNTTDLSENPSKLQDSYGLIRLSEERETLIYEAIPQLWNDAKIHHQSGDCAALFDFSEVEQPGSYIIRNNRTREESWSFLIADNVYRDVLVAATRMFFYQRSGFPKQPPYTDPRWTDEAAFLGPGQDPEAHFIEDKRNASLARDMRGGWFDAGDTNKYVTFASVSVHQLLDAYRQNPDIWTDDFNLPESGNGIPDLLDEIRYELDWLKRMQAEDGGVFIKIGTTNYQVFERPSLDPRPRFYAAQCSSSTIDTAGMFAHAALVFRSIPSLNSESLELQERAIKAWHWYHTNPRKTDCDSQEIKAGDADRTLSQQDDSAITAAIYISALTSDVTYSNYVTEHLENYCFYCHDTWYPYHSNLGDALLYYAQQPQASPEIQARLVERIKTIAKSSKIYGVNPETSPYQSYMPDDQYHWGSNAIQALYGISNFDVYTLQIQDLPLEPYYDRALEALHYFHGVNPLGLVYLSNMYSYGASFTVNEIYHDWFGHGIYDNAITSPSGPAPGYLTGGPNKNYTGDAPVNLEHPMRSYIDINNKRHSMYIWELTEPAIYYQSAYVKLLSRLIAE